MSDKLSIRNEMRNFDHKERGFYDELTEEERKKFSTFLMLKYGGNVEGSVEMQEWYLRSHNERVNRNFFDIGKHPKLQWLTCTTVSPGMGSQSHFWLTPKKKVGDNKAHKFLAKLYPDMKQADIEAMVSMNTRDDLKALARTFGWDEKQIKADL